MKQTCYDHAQHYTFCCRPRLKCPAAHQAIWALNPVHVNVRRNGPPYTATNRLAPHDAAELAICGISIVRSAINLHLAVLSSFSFTRPYSELTELQVSALQ